jgi:hypothetical protein
MIRKKRRPKYACAVGATERNALAEARRALGLTLRQSPVVKKSDSHVVLKTGDVVELLIQQHAESRAEVFEVM